jgi:hypothetical protein
MRLILALESQDSTSFVLFKIYIQTSAKVNLSKRDYFLEIRIILCVFPKLTKTQLGPN